MEYGALAVAGQRNRRSMEELRRISPADGVIAGMGTVNAALFSEERAGVVVARRKHPGLRGRLDLPAYLRMEHVMVSSRRRGPAPEDLGLGQLGHHRRVRLRCRNYGAAFRIVQETDFLLTMPARYAGLLNERAGHRLLKLPFAMPTLDLYLYWHEAAHDDPANRWLRAQLLEVLGKSASVSKTAR